MTFRRKPKHKQQDTPKDRSYDAAVERAERLRRDRARQPPKHLKKKR